MIYQPLPRVAERYDKELNKYHQRIMEIIMPIVLIIMASPIGATANLIDHRHLPDNLQHRMSSTPGFGGWPERWSSP